MKKIVVVEDNQVVASVYRAKLQAEGFQVEVASDGEAELELIKRTAPDLVLLDLVLPKLGGVEILKYLRGQTEFRFLPVIVFSSSYVSDEAWQAGATQVLNKATHRPKQVVDEVKNLLAAACATSTANGSPQSTVFAPDKQVASSDTPRTSDVDADAEFQAGLKKTLLDGAPETLRSLNESLQDFNKNTTDPTNLFALYRKVHALTGNAGLSGLTLVSRLANALEALLKELSDRPKGINPSVLRTVAQAVELFPSLFSRNSERDEDNTSSLNVLVVDDEEIARRAVTYALEKANLRALRVAEAATALKILNENRFDLLFLDIEMPELSGLQLYAKLRTNSLHEKTPVIFMTTPNEFMRHIQSSLSVETDLIAKPFSYTEVAVKALTLLLKGSPTK